MASNRTGGQLNRLYAELDQLSGRGAARPPRIGEALAAAADVIQRRPPAARATTEARLAKARSSIAPMRAAAMAAAAAGGWLATRPRRKQPTAPAKRWWLPGVLAAALTGTAVGSAWLALRGRQP